METLPSRIQQLLQCPTIEAPLPPELKTIIDKLIKSPLQDIASTLSEFSWQYGKGNFNHWRPLFNHFETYFEECLSCRSDLLLTDTAENDKPFPRESVLQILRVMQVIVENCHNKSTVSCLEYIQLLLASTDPEIIIATLETLSALVKVHSPKVHASGKLVRYVSMNSCLLSLAQGWGSKEDGLGLYSCLPRDDLKHKEGLSHFASVLQDSSDKSLCRMGSTLYFKYHRVNSESVSEDNDGWQASSSYLIHIPDIHLQTSDDLTLMRKLIDEFNVPVEHRFSLLTRIRYARSFRSPTTGNLYSQISILAFIVLVQSHDSHEELVSFFAKEVDYINELIMIIKSEETVHCTIRTLATRALFAYTTSNEQTKILGGPNTGLREENRMVLMNVVQREIYSLTDTTDSMCLGFVKALLLLFFIDVSSSTSESMARFLGMIPIVFPLLEDSKPAYLAHLAVKIFRKLIDKSNIVSNLLKDLDGVKILTHRLQLECSRLKNLFYSERKLIKVLLRVIGSLYSPGDHSSLVDVLSRIFKNVDHFGGDIFSSAATLMSTIIYTDPMSFCVLNEMGLPGYFLDFIVAGLVPSSRALICVPNTLDAICLNAKGLEAVKETSALCCFIDVFTSERHLAALNEGIVPLAKGFEELLRHFTTLRTNGVEIIIKIVNKITSIADNAGGSRKVNSKANKKKFIRQSICHVVVLLHIMTENSELCRIFVENSGIEALFRLVLRPCIMQSPEGIFIASHITLLFDKLTIHHFARLAHAWCSFLSKYLKKALGGLYAASGSFNLDSDSEFYSHILIVNFLLFLAASKECCRNYKFDWSFAMLNEFGNEGTNLLQDIGRLHREVMWQMALFEDAQLEIDCEVVNSMDDSRHYEERNDYSYIQFRLEKLTRWIGDVQSNKTGASVKSLSCSVTFFMQELGKMMLNLFPKQHFEPTESSCAKIVASAFASTVVEHLNSEGPANSVGSEVSVSTKCRFLRIIVNLVDACLMDSLDVCNPIVLNIFYCSGVIQSVMTTLEATIHLLFAVIRDRGSPMETNDRILRRNEKEDADIACVYGTLATYGRLMDHLVKLNFCFKLEKHILSHPLASGSVEFPRNVETLYKCLKSMVLKEILLLCTHVHFKDIRYDFIATVITIIYHVCYGIDEYEDKPEMKSYHTNSALQSYALSHIVNQMRLCGLSAEMSNMLYALFHALSLIITEDRLAQEVALEAGLLNVASDLLSQWLVITVKSQVPKWAEEAFIVIDQLLQVHQGLNEYDLVELLEKDVFVHEDGIVFDEKHEKLIIICCGYLKKPISSNTMRVVLVLCITLTKTHLGSKKFLEIGGLTCLLSLPTTSLFPGFSRIATVIICQIMEDPFTLQEAMISEIREIFFINSNRSTSSYITLSNFWNNCEYAISRDLKIFVEAARSVCNIDWVDGNLFIVYKDNLEEKERENKFEENTVIEFFINKVISFIPHNGKGNTSMDQMVFFMKLLKKFIISYSSSIQVMLRLDECLGGGVFKHIIHQFILCSLRLDKDETFNLATTASQFLVAVCVKSEEARHRVFLDIKNVFNLHSPSSVVGFRHIIRLVEIISEVFVARSLEASATLIVVGLEQSLTQALDVLPLDHTESGKVVTMIIQILEILTKGKNHGVSRKCDIITKLCTSIIGSPPMVSRRHLDTLSILRQFKLLEVEKDNHEGSFSVLLSMLTHPLYFRSVVHLEQLLITIRDFVTREEILLLPKPGLEILCSLLAREGLSDNAYGLIPDILRKLLIIAPTHCHVLQEALVNLLPNLTNVAMDEIRTWGETRNLTLTSVGAAILRVLQTLDSLAPNDEYDYSDVRAILKPLWNELSLCISRVDCFLSPLLRSSSKSWVSPLEVSPGPTPIPAVTRNILPFFQSFFLIREELQPTIVPEVEEPTTSAGKQKISENEKLKDLIKFLESHKELLNAFIRQNPGLLEKSFSLMLKVPRCIDFGNKITHFRSKLKHQHGHFLNISVRRDTIFEDSYNMFRMQSMEDLKGILAVKFQGEEGIDAGGLTREWYQVLSRVIFDKDMLLFTPVGDSLTYQPNPNFVRDHTDHLLYFKFVGRLFGKALFDGQLLDAHFTQSFYKHILGDKVTYQDVEAIDSVKYRSLIWYLENDISNEDLSFNIDLEILTSEKKKAIIDYDLVPGGGRIRVTEENKHKYVDLIVEHQFTTAIRPQIDAFLDGFNELIHHNLISIFDVTELKQLISGVPDIDVDDMMENTEYFGYSAVSPVIQWFWEVVRSLSKNDLTRLLQFVTGNSQMPLEGFSVLQHKIQIHKAYVNEDHLPSAHTCFNQLKLVEYPSKECLEKRLLYAIREASEGFWFS